MRTKGDYKIMYADIAKYVRLRYAETGFPVTLRDIMRALPRYKSTSHTRHAVGKLVEVGVLRVRDGRAGIIPA